MNRKTAIFAVIILIVVLSLVGCSSKTSDAVKNFQSAELDENGNIVIQKDSITSDATYFNYEVDGITVQILAVRASDDTVRLAYNTCQVCNPSPKAYFVQQDGVFICQNCGNRFKTDVVGLSSFGCNPTTVSGLTETDETITIDSEAVESIAARFTYWSGPTE